MSRKRSAAKAKRSGPERLPFGFNLNNVLPICLLATVIALAYNPLFSNSFVDYDDPEYITRNPHINSGLTIETWWWACTSLRSGNWHPLTWISHALDVSLFGFDAAGHHSNSLLIHVLNAVLIFLLLSAITREKGPPLVVAALFGLHPLAVESVSWAAERKNVLCTLFFLLALAAYARYARHPSVARYLPLVIAFALGLSAKPMVITLPFVLLLLDFWPLARVEGSSFAPLFSATQRGITTLILEKVPLLVLSVGSAIITWIAQSSAGAVASTGPLPLAARISNAIYSYFGYILKAFVPTGLAPFYPEAPRKASEIAVASLFIIVVSTAVWLVRVRRPYLMVGWLFYLGTLVPVIGLVQVGGQAMADRYTYIPMIGIFVAVVWLADDLAIDQQLSVAARALVAAAILATLAVLTWRQVGLWHDDITLWSYNLEVTNNNVVAEDNLGIAFLKVGRTEEALAHFYKATQLAPDDPISAANVATDLLSHGRTQEAIAKYEVALAKARFVPMLLPNIHSNLGSAFLSMGNVDQAREHYKLALGLNPDDTVARRGLERIEQVPLIGTIPPSRGGPQTPH